jgi:hypothetical protein
VSGKYTGQQLSSYTGMGNNESHDLMNRKLEKHNKALNLGGAEISSLDSIMSRKVTVKILTVKEWPEVIDIMPSEYYSSVCEK